MQFVKVFCIIFLAVYSSALLYYCLKSGKFFKTLLVSTLSGTAVMIAVDLLSAFTGVSLPLNPYTAVGGALFGVPGVLGLLTLRLFF